MDVLLTQRSGHAGVNPANRNTKSVLVLVPRNVLYAMMAATTVISFVVAPLLAERSVSPEKSGEATTKPEQPRADQPDVVPIKAVLNRMPEDIRPTKSDWDKLKLPKAAEWFKKNMHGRTINLPVFLRSVSTDYLGKDKYKVEVSYQLRLPRFSFNGFPMQFVPRFETMHGTNLYSAAQNVLVTYRGDESFARQWANTGEDTPIVVQGTVSRVSLALQRFKKGAVCKITITGIQAPVEEKPGIKEPVEDKSSEEDPPRVLSVLAILNRMPRNLLPDPASGWDKATLLRVNDWLRKYVRRKPFRGQLEFAKCDVSHIKGAVYKVVATWKMLPDIGFAFSKQAAWLKLTVYTDLSDSMGTSLTDLSHSIKQTYTVNHANAKRWESMSKGGRVDIGGQIASVGLSNNRDSGYICTVKVQMTKMSEQRARLALTRKPKKPKRPHAKTKTAADQAASQVRLAKAYLSSGVKAKALPILKAVIEKYPNTQAATEAKKLLKGAGE